MTLTSSIVEPIKRHLHDRLPKMCEADPEALSSYILALLQRDQSMDALRDSCLTELTEFLGGQTAQFVSGLFSLIADLASDARSSSIPSSSTRKRHHDPSSRSGSRSASVYSPGSASHYSNDKRHRRDDRYSSSYHNDQRRGSGGSGNGNGSSGPGNDGYRHIDDDYNQSYMDVRDGRPYASPYDDRQPLVPTRGYNDYRTGGGGSGPQYGQRHRHESRSGAPMGNDMVQPQVGGSQSRPRHGEQRQHPSQHSSNRNPSWNNNSAPSPRPESAPSASAAPTQQPRSPTNLFISNVPRDLNNLATLSAYFGRFGEIVNIQIKADANKAFIQFKTHSQAKAALGCPEAVCNNRFIKVFWARYDPMDKEAGLASDIVTGAAAPSILDEQALLLRQQEKEAQVRRDRLQLNTELKTKKTMMDKLKSMTGENAARQATITKLEEECTQLESRISALPAVEDSALPAPTDGHSAGLSIQDQLAQAEKEAAAFGLVDEFGNIVYGKSGYRGGRGAKAGTRASGRGRRGRGNGRQSMTLDNRTRILSVRNIPESYVNEKMVRSHFQSFGEISGVEMGAFGEPTSALVEFKNRNIAQSALSFGTSMLQRTLTLDWYDGSINASEANIGPHAGVVAAAGDHNAADVISDDDDDEDVDRSWKR
uniref:RRM domain-containing protein n=1 Tax=Spongospora subterranea TaxID=70186 RepID=A0A0H5RKZ1_9EUKA|eukprot:CRZ09389.1 hypothetical protein [Spongospora subterranea]